MFLFNLWSIAELLNFSKLCNVFHIFSCFDGISVRLLKFRDQNRCVKSVRIWSFSGSYFLAFGPNTEKYSVSVHTVSILIKRILPFTET